MNLIGRVGAAHGNVALRRQHRQGLWKITVRYTKRGAHPGSSLGVSRIADDSDVANRGLRQLLRPMWHRRIEQKRVARQHGEQLAPMSIGELALEHVDELAARALVHGE